MSSFVVSHRPFWWHRCSQPCFHRLYVSCLVQGFLAATGIVRHLDLTLTAVPLPSPSLFSFSWFPCLDWQPWSGIWNEINKAALLVCWGDYVSYLLLSIVYEIILVYLHVCVNISSHTICYNLSSCNIILLFRNLENVNVPAGIRPQINICLVLFCPWKAHWFILLELARLTTLSPGGGRCPRCSGASAFGKASAWIWPSSHEPPCQWKQGPVKLIYQWKNKRGRAGGGKCTIQRLNKASGHQERLY